jgi:hypothetical protein
MLGMRAPPRRATDVEQATHLERRLGDLAWILRGKVALRFGVDQALADLPRSERPCDMPDEARVWMEDAPTLDPRPRRVKLCVTFTGGPA